MAPKKRAQSPVCRARRADEDGVGTLPLPLPLPLPLVLEKASSDRTPAVGDNTSLVILFWFQRE